MKQASFRATSLDDLRSFPELARREAGYQIDRIQKGKNPTDYKPMPAVGKSVYEIRIEEASGAFRVMYVAKFEKVVYVLHCFQKKSQKTAKRDIDLAKSRYRDLEKELRDEK